MADYAGASTVVTGTFGVDDRVTALDVIDMTPMLFQRYKNIDPFFKIFNAINGQRTRMNGGKNPDAIDPSTAQAHNFKINWPRAEHRQRWFYLTTSVAASTSAGATVTLIPAQTAGGSAYTSDFRVGHVIKYPNGTMDDNYTNVGVITTVNTGTSIVVDPIGYDSDGSSTDKKFSATTAGDKIQILHDAAEEYSQSPTAIAAKDTTEWNYIHFERSPIITGNIMMDVKRHIGPQHQENVDKEWREIRISCENALIWGERYVKSPGAGSAGDQYFMRGMWEYIRNGGGVVLNNWTAGLTIDDVDEYLVQGPMREGYGSDVRIWFTSTELGLKLKSLMREKIGQLPEKNMFGFDFEQYNINGKKVYLRNHSLFTDDHEGKGIIVDPASCRIRPYGTQGAIRLLENIQENDRAGRKDEYQTIFSFQMDRVEPNSYQTP